MSRWSAVRTRVRLGVMAWLRAVRGGVVPSDGVGCLVTFVLVGSLGGWMALLLFVFYTSSIMSAAP